MTDDKEKNFGLLGNVFRSRFVRFGIVGGIGSAVNFGFYIFFHEVLGIYYILANIMAIEISVLSNFILNERWTFSDRKRAGRNTYLKRLLAFAFTASLVAWFTQTPTLFVLHQFFHVGDRLAVIIGIFVGALLNYFVSNYLIFKGKTPSPTLP